ncbi:ABC transporter permease [Rickettsiales bacterium]|nr:ABC transporter permease [Rickettsiales bacterium]
MNDYISIILESFRLILKFDNELFEIITLSLRISLIALFISTFISFPLAALFAVTSFCGKNFLILISNSLMGLPPVLVGLVLYIVFSSSGPLGYLEILYTPTIMIIAQVILIFPIIFSLSYQVLSDILDEYDELLKSLKADIWQKIITITWDARYSLLTCILAGLGRAMSEVGAIIIVGGNIAHLTRVMTTSIALETSKGNLELAISLGIILILISMFLNSIVYSLKLISKKYSYD